MNPNDPQAEITRMKDGRTELGYKAEHAVDMESGAVVAVTAHGGATGDTASIQETLPAAGEAIAEQIGQAQDGDAAAVHLGGVEELVADKGYHSNEVLRASQEAAVRTYVAEPKRGRRKWEGKKAEQRAVYGNRRRVRGERGKDLLRQRGIKLERCFAHMYATGGLRRLRVRGKVNVRKKLLLQAMAYNLALLLRNIFGAGSPKALKDRVAGMLFAFLRLLDAVSIVSAEVRPKRCTHHITIQTYPAPRRPENGRFRHGLLAVLPRGRGRG